MEYSLFDRQDTGKPFACRYPYPLWTYVVPPSKETDSPPLYTFDFKELWLREFLATYSVAAGDTLQLVLLNRRIQFQGIRVTVCSPSQGLVFSIRTNSGAIFAGVDCSVVGSKILLPGGATLDSAGSLVETSFIVDNPDCIEFTIDSIGNGLSSLVLKVDVMYSNSFSGLGPTNENGFKAES